MAESPAHQHTSAAVIQRSFRRWIERCAAAETASGKNAEAADATNRQRLNVWAGTKAKDAKQRDLAKHNGSRQQYRSHLDWKAASRLAETQQKRAGAVQRGVRMRGWLPVGLAAVHDPVLGATLQSTMQVHKGDVVLVEKVRVAAAPTPTLTDLSTEAEQHACWEAQLDAYAAADAATKKRVSTLPAACARGPCGGCVRLTSIPPHSSVAPNTPVTSVCSVFLRTVERADVLADVRTNDDTSRQVLRMHQADAAHTLAPAEAVALGTFAAKHVGTDLAAAAKQVPLVFRGNAVQDRAGRAVLPIVGSLFSHSCNPNTIRTLDAPKPGEVEFVAARGIARREEVTVSYIGHQLWPRARRQEHLQLSKGFDCECVRCSQPDLEAPLPCPACSPIQTRPQGFHAPVHPARADAGAGTGSGSGSGRPGYIAHHPMVYTLNSGSSTAGRWVCDIDRGHVFSTDDLKAIPLPEGAPAQTYHGLLEYADNLGEGLSAAPAEMLDSDEATHFAQALLLVVGQYHWAAQTLNLRVLQSLSPDGSLGPWSLDRVQSAAEDAAEWVQEWLGLEPALYIGPAALLNTAAALIKANRVLPAVKLWKLVQQGTPAQSQVNATAGQLLAAVQGGVDAAAAELSGGGGGGGGSAK